MTERIITHIVTTHTVTTNNNFMSSLCFGSLNDAASVRVLFDVCTAGRVLYDGGMSVEE